MKVLVKPVLDVSHYKNVDGVILPLKGYSTDYDTYYTMDEIVSIKEKFSGEIFVVLNRMFFNRDIDDLACVLRKLEQLELTGIFFYDLAVLQLKDELDLKTDFVWNSTHMVTNYETCNYYFKRGVKYAFLSNEITLDEILEIKEKSKITPIFMLIGYPVVANSYRHLVTNYNKMHHQDLHDKIGIHERVSGENYIVCENEFGTTFKADVVNHVAALDLLEKVNFPYVVLNEDLMEHDVFMEILDIIINHKDLERIYELIGNNTGFLYKETIYRVKKNG